MVKPALSALVERLSGSDGDANLSLTNPNRLKIEILAGLTVALALVPEAVAFAFVAGVIDTPKPHNSVADKGIHTAPLYSKGEQFV